MSDANPIEPSGTSLSDEVKKARADVKEAQEKAAKAAWDAKENARDKAKNNKILGGIVIAVTILLIIGAIAVIAIIAIIATNSSGSGGAFIQGLKVAFIQGLGYFI